MTWFWRWRLLSKALAIKTHVFDLLTNNLEDFTVTWGFTTRNVDRQWCYLGDLVWPESEWRTNRSRRHTVSLPIVLNCVFARKSPQEAEAFMHEQLERLEALFDATSDVRTVGAETWGLAPQGIGTQPHTDGIEAQATFELRVTYRP